MVYYISRTLAPGPGTVPSTLLGEMRYKDPAVPVPSELYLPPKQATPSPSSAPPAQHAAVVRVSHSNQRRSCPRSTYVSSANTPPYPSVNSSSWFCLWQRWHLSFPPLNTHTCRVRNPTSTAAVSPAVKTEVPAECPQGAPGEPFLWSHKCYGSPFLEATWVSKFFSM